MVASNADLIAAINAANASSDASSTITLTQSFQVAPGNVPTPTKALTIDTQGFTLTGNPNINWSNPASGAPTLTLLGNFTGTNAVGTGGSLSVFNGSVINDGSIKGFSSGATGTAQHGVQLSGTSTFVNNGSITGGDAPSIGTAGIGVNTSITGGLVTLTNNGTIQGGSTSGRGGAFGVVLGTPTNGTLTNTGTIRGGSDLIGTKAGGAAVETRKTGPAGIISIVNSGTLIGGNDAVAIFGLGAINLINSGTIQAGSGQTDAINFFAGSTGRLVLELDAGSVINGNVVASAAAANNAFRLGGSTNASFDTSSIGSTAQYQNFNTFEKIGTSTWTLTGTTTAVTPWTLTDGILQISSDGNLGDASGGLTFNGGTLENTASLASARSVAMTANGTLLTDAGTTLTLNGVLSGAGALAKDGAGTLVLNAANTYAGGTTVDAGTLIVGDATHNVAALGAGLTTVAAGATLGGYGSVSGAVNNNGTISAANALASLAASAAGTLRIGGDLNNAGIVNLAAASGQTGNVLNVAGNYTGTNGQVVLNTVLNEGGNATQSDRLVIGGNASGSTLLQLNRSGSGTATTGNGIQLVQVGGTSAANSFHLAAPIQAGAYQYLLYQGGPTDANSWYLRSQFDPVTATDSTGTGGTGTAPSGTTGNAASGAASQIAYRPGVAGYAVTPLLVTDYGFTMLGRLQERVGDQASVEAANQSASKNGVWGRIGGQNLQADAGNRFSADEHTFFAQFGKDWTVARGTNGGSTHTGATLSFGSTSASFADSARGVTGQLSDTTGTVETQAQSVGGYWTKYLPDGTYFDTVGQLTHYQNQYGDVYGGNGRQNGFGAGVSGEAGKPFSLGVGGIAIEPQAQLLYQYIHLNHFSDGISDIGTNTTNALRGRLGFRLFRANLDNDAKNSTLTPYLTVDVLHDFFSPGQTSVGGATLDNQLGKTWYDVGVGLTGSFGKSSSVYANVTYAHSISGDYRRNVFGQAGYRFSW